METIMNNTNGHNPDLVEKINNLYNNPKKKECFYTIIQALMYRDGEEIIDKGITTEKNFYYSSCDWHGEFYRYAELFAHDYLMHVADDRDLEIIINFCR